MKHDIIIIGGGAAGIMAAITAKDFGKDVAILEANDRVGKKILTTGNGRCNITNENLEVSRYHSENSHFFDFSLEAFDFNACRDFFMSIGLPLVTLENSKVFPMSLQASSVLDVLRTALNEREIPIYTDNKVKAISSHNNIFKLTTVQDAIFECNSLILATGGKSASKTGSDGSGYNLAKTLGHKIINPIPALVQLKLNYKNLKALSGIKFDGYAEIIIDNEPLRKEFGEILFTDYGISGPPILQLSRIASHSLSKGKKVILKIDMFPSKNKTELIQFLENHWGTFSYRSIYDSFIGVINKKLIPILLKQGDLIDIHKPCYSLTQKEKNNLFTLLKGWEFEVCDTNSFSNAQVTAGGIDTRDVNKTTMESTIVKNLFFCGEILDVDGDCGGFNLHFAWSSGYLAGKNASGV